jgi:vitamin B12 transporter
MKKRIVIVAAGLGFAQLAASNLAFAQDTLSINEVVVSATKLDQKQSQTGKVVSVITRDVIEKSRGKTVPQLLSEQAGFYIAGAQGTPGKDKSLFLRGAATAYTPILIDGMPVNDPSTIGAIFDIRLLSMDQIERIEILRGGQSTLYGSDAVAGVINIITKKGGKEPFAASVLAKAGSYGTFEGNLALSGTISGLTYNLNYSHLQSDGISDAKKNANTFFDKDRYIQDGLNTSLSYAVNSELSINPFFRYQYFDSQYDNGAFSDSPTNVTFSHFLSTGLNSVYSKGSSKVTLNYNFSTVDRIYKSSFPYDGTIHFADLFLTQKLSKNIQFVAGLEERLIKITQKGAPDETPDANLLSAYSSFAFSDLAKYFDLELGGRYNDHSRYGSNLTYSVTPSVKFFDNGFRLFGTVGTAFKAPTLTELYGAFGANPKLKPQKADNYEVGFVVKPNANFNLRVVGYERYIKDAIIYGPNGYDNLDIQDDWGAEVEPSFSSKYVDVKAFYAFVKGKTVTEGASGNYVKSDFLLRRPKHAVGINVGVKPNAKLYTSLNFRNYSERHDAYFDLQSFTTQTVVNGAYQLLDAYAEYKFNKQLRLFVNLNNLLDENYQEIAGYSTMGANFIAGISFQIK